MIVSPWNLASPHGCGSSGPGRNRTSVFGLPESPLVICLKDGSEQEISEEVGNRLAALTDGEGHFAIGQINKRKPGGGTCNCSFKIKLRDDDAPFLEHMQRIVGLGKIIRLKGTDTNPNPCILWVVHAKKEVEELVAIFDRFPLWSKKQRDFAVWKEAVLYWNYPYLDDWGRIDWETMDVLKDELKAVREYRELPEAA